MANRLCLTAFACVCLFVSGCSSTPERKTITYSTGDKAAVEKLTYNVIDTQILPHLGEPTAQRTPQNRFYVVDLSVSNSGSSDSPIPGMELIDDGGKVYGELADGSGVPHWLGVLRRVQANQTEQGAIVFDAPAGHYKLRLTDDTDASEVFVDIPLSFAHEQMQNDTQFTSEAAAAAGGAANTAPPKKQ